MHRYIQMIDMIDRKIYMQIDRPVDKEIDKRS